MSLRIKGKRILVTGGAGSIGSELVRQLAVDNKVFILDTNETGAFDLREELKHQGFWAHSRTGDIRDKSVVFDVFSDFKPQYVFHAAALKHVTPNEEYPEEAISTNILGTQNLIKESKNWDCFEKFVFISTDKVVNARGIMGITKLCAESLVRNAGKRFIAVRFGNVMSSRGSVLEIWQRQLDRGEPLTITHPDMERYMMTIPQACELVIKAAEEGEGGEVFILDMGKRVNIKWLAEQILLDSGKLEEYTRRGQLAIKEIGVRPGETMDEKIMTTDEEQVAVKQGNFFIIK